MFKKNNIKKLNQFIVWLTSILIALAVGNLFVSGFLLNAKFLSWIPLLGHQILGWVLIGFALLGVFLKIKMLIK